MTNRHSIASLQSPDSRQQSQRFNEHFQALEDLCDDRAELIAKLSRQGVPRDILARHMRAWLADHREKQRIEINERRRLMREIEQEDAIAN